MHIFHSLELLHSIPISLYSLCVHSCTSIYKFQSVVYCLVDIESVPLVAHYLSQPLVCTSTVWSTPLSATGMHIHRVEHTSLSHWYAHPPCGAHLSQPLVCTSTAVHVAGLQTWHAQLYPTRSFVWTRNEVASTRPLLR